MNGKIRLAIALSALVALAGSAYADFNVLDKTTYKQNATSGARVDEQGHQTTVEQYPAQGFNVIQPSVLSTQFLHITGALASVNIGAHSGFSTGTYAVSDSTPAINVAGYSRLALLIYPTCDDSAWAGVFALSWRLHSSATADSQNTYLEQPWNRFRNAANGVNSATVSDSLTVRPDSIGTLFPRERNLLHSAGGPGVAANDRLAMLTENVLVINDTATNHRGRLVYLTNKDGQPVSGTYISLQWRHLLSYVPSSVVSGSLVGIPATNSTEIRWRLRADLVGWR